MQLSVRNSHLVREVVAHAFTLALRRKKLGFEADLLYNASSRTASWGTEKPCLAKSNQPAHQPKNLKLSNIFETAGSIPSTANMKEGQGDGSVEKDGFGRTHL